MALVAFANDKLNAFAMALLITAGFLMTPEVIGKLRGPKPLVVRHDKRLIGGGFVALIAAAVATLVAYFASSAETALTMKPLVFGTIGAIGGCAIVTFFLSEARKKRRERVSSAFFLFILGSAIQFLIAFH